MLHDESLISLHREFLRGLSIQLGEAIATVRGGHPQPSPEVMEKEVEDVLTHYLVMEKGGVSDVVNETAHWMMRLMDPYNRHSYAHSMYITEVLISFFMSTLKILIDKGIVEMSDPPEVEKTWKLSTEHKFLEDELADLDTWNKILKHSLKDILNDKTSSILSEDDDEYDEEEEDE